MGGEESEAKEEVNVSRKMKPGALWADSLPRVAAKAGRVPCQSSKK